MGSNITITVYGSEQICSTCIGAPGSVDTYEWLQAAIGRKYPMNHVNYRYVDIESPPQEHQAFAQQITREDMFYPIIFVNDELVAEGIPRLKSIYQALNKHGLQCSG